MVGVYDKKNNPILRDGIAILGEIVFEDNDRFKLHTSSEIFSKKKYNFKTIK